MLTILGSKQRFCDGLSRRSFLTAGALSAKGRAAPELVSSPRPVSEVRILD